MNIWSSINIILNLVTLINTILTIIICVFIVLLVLIFRRQSCSVPILLASHTCLILIILSFLLGSMVTSSLLGFLNISLEQHGNTKWCLWRGFFIHGILCVLYDSYMLQATYRFFRVVFHHYRYLHKFSLYCFLILIESFFGLISISPVLIRNDVIYLPSEYYCQTPFTNIPAIVYVAVRLFLLPIIFISIVYICLLKYVHRRSLLSSNNYRRSRQNRRSLIIIKRLLLILSILILLGLPSVIFLLILIFTGHLVSITYRVGWLSVSFSLVFLAYMIIQLTKPLRKLVRKIFCCRTITVVDRI